MADTPTPTAMETRDESSEVPSPQAPQAAAATSNKSSSGSGATKKRKAGKKVPKQHRVGNFRSYYTFRLGQSRQGELEDDPRLSVLDATWFRGKRGLDIGCNSGDLTIAIAKKLAPAYLLGVDVDAQLVARARSHLKELLQQEQIAHAFASIPAVTSTSSSSAAAAPQDTIVTVPQLTKKLESASTGGATTTRNSSSEHAPQGDMPAAAPANSESALAVPFAAEMPLSFRLWKPPVASAGLGSKALGKVPTGTSFPANVVFKREDIVSDTHAGKDYDVITCFSVTKWIHLFHGDDGIKRVFAKIHALLAPGGRFIVEPQPWKSYHKRKFTTEVTAANYARIALRPKDFPAFLVDTVGFKRCTFLQVCRTSANGFRRPVYVLEK